MTSPLPYELADRVHITFLTDHATSAQVSEKELVEISRRGILARQLTIQTCPYVKPCRRRILENLPYDREMDLVVKRNPVDKEPHDIICTSPGTRSVGHHIREQPLLFCRI